MMIKYQYSPVFFTLNFPRLRIFFLGQNARRRGKKDQSWLRIRATELEQNFPVVANQPNQLVKTHAPRSFLTRIVSFILSLIILTSSILLMIMYSPRLYFTIFPHQAKLVQANETGTALGGKFEPASAEQADQSDSSYQPPYDPNLPAGNWLIIPKIGVRSELQITEDYVSALEKGLWLVPDFGRPGNELPIIIAGHRYGWQWWWQSDYWRYHSFYLLPDLKPGDIVEVIAEQRKWTYEIYRGEESTEISDYEADIILYTCKFLNSPIRHIRYGRLINPDKDSQAD